MSNDHTFLTMDQLAERWHVTVRTLGNWMKEDKIPQPIKPSAKKYLWRLTDIIKYEASLENT